MVIIQKKTGRLANRLFLFSKFISNAIENGYELFNPTFDEYCGLFESTRSNNFNGHPISVKPHNSSSYRSFKLKTTLLRIAAPHTSIHEFVTTNSSSIQDLSDPGFVNKARQKKVYARGWYFNDGGNMKKHASEIRKIFTPDNSVKDTISACLTPIRADYDVLIGLHIRRGDYRTWKSGRYFYNNETYRHYMKVLQMQFNEIGKSVAFVLCSNDSIDLNWFSDFSCYHAPGGMISDLYTLAECDYIFGPPSTYSMWASYYGKRPLKHLEHPRQIIHYQSFQALYC